MPQMLSRIIEGEKSARALDKGKMLVPKLLAQGFGAKVGDTVVVVATNKDGSVNGKTFLVSGILESATGPGGRDGYINFDDAREILRMSGKEVSEIAVRVKSLPAVEGVAQSIRAGLGLEEKRQKGGGIEVHTWSQLSPFANIANMIDLMTFFIKLMLIAIVLISILNVMIMAVYERVREIGTIAAIGTLPRKILSLFLVEGFCLGVTGAIVGVVFGLGIIFGVVRLENYLQLWPGHRSDSRADDRPDGSRNGFSYGDHCFRTRKPATSVQGFQNGAHRRPKACIGKATKSNGFFVLWVSRCSWLPQCSL